MGIDPGRLRPYLTQLKGFFGDVVQLVGVITLPVLAESKIWAATAMNDFLVVKAPSTYNVILGRPILNQFKVVTSTYHLKMKFSTPNGLGELHGEQAIAQDCYIQELKKSWVKVPPAERQV